MVTYITNYTNTTLECYTNVIENVTSQVCYGTIAVVPYNQDVIVVLLAIIAFCAVCIMIYLLSKLVIN